MIHGYDDSTKEKVEVYSTGETYSKSEVYAKSETIPATNFVYLEGTIPDVPPLQWLGITVNATDIPEIGTIANLSKWIVTGAMQRKNLSVADEWENLVHDSLAGTSDANRADNRPVPLVRLIPVYGQIRIEVFNYDLTRTLDVDYRVLLQKVKN